MGKTREHFIREGIQKYLRYLKPYTGIEMLELKEEKIKDLKEAPIVRKKEAEKIFKSLPRDVPRDIGRTGRRIHLS
jgi:23S rRNA (pseudouridine1915-N3)-methyltransferase